MNMTVICMVPVRFSPQFDGALAMKADSRIARGVVETAGIGAAAGHVATSAAAGVGLHAVSETKHAGVSEDAKRLADSVAKQVAQVGVSEGWMTPDRIKG